MRLLALLALLVAVAPGIAPYGPGQQFPGFQYAPPMRPHVVDANGTWHRPFAYAVRVDDPLERRYSEDRSVRVTSFSDPQPWFLLGSDALGRDVLSRLLIGARLSLGIALSATLCALAFGAAVGALCGYAGGWIDALLMRLADAVLVLPAIYVVLALRGALPLVLETTEVFIALVAVLSLVGWPVVARGVRRSCAGERRQSVAGDDAAPSAGGARVSRGPGDRPRPRLRDGGSDVVVCGTWVWAADAELGRDAVGGQRSDCGRCAVAACARGRHRGNGVRGQCR